MKKAIAMKCSQKDWDSIKGRIPKKHIDLDRFGGFKSDEYLVNNLFGIENKICNISFVCKKENERTVHETFNAKIFLNACGIDCDVYEITKEQVLELAQHTHLAKNWFPDAFKKELEVGKWYKWNDSLFCYNGKKDQDGYACGFGFVYGDFVENDDNDGFGSSGQDDFIEATPQEVEAALICEAKKREFEDGNYKCMSTVGRTHKHNFDYIYDFYDNIVFTGWNENDQRNIIFKDGQWAQIIETITIQEAEKLLNKKIV